MAINNEINNKYFTAFIKGLFGPNANLIYIPLKMKSKAIGTIREGDIIYCVKHNVSGTYISFYRVNEEITLENTTIDSPDQEWDWTVEFGNKIQEINLDNIVDRVNSMSTTIAFLMESIPFVIKDNKIKIFNKLPILKYKDMLDYCRAGVNVFALFEDFGVRRDKFTKLTVNEQYKKYFDLEHRNVDGLVYQLDPKNGKSLIYSDDADLVHILYTADVYNRLNDNTMDYNKKLYGNYLKKKFISIYAPDNSFLEDTIKIHNDALGEIFDVRKTASEKIQKLVYILNNKKNTIKQLNFENKYTITENELNINRKIDYSENPPELKYINKLRLLIDEDLSNKVINDTDNTKFANTYMSTEVPYIEENIEKSMIIYPLLVYAKTPNANNFDGNVRKVVEWRPPVIKNIDYSELTKKLSLTVDELAFHAILANIGLGNVPRNCIKLDELDLTLLNKHIPDKEERYTPSLRYEGSVSGHSTSGELSDIEMSDMLKAYPKEVRSSIIRIYDPTIESGKEYDNIIITKNSDMIYNDVSNSIFIFSPTKREEIMKVYNMLNDSKYKLLNRHYPLSILDHLKNKGLLKTMDVNDRYLSGNSVAEKIDSYNTIYNDPGQIYTPNRLDPFLQTPYGQSEDCKNKLFKNIYIPFEGISSNGFKVYYMSLDGITDETSFKKRYDAIFRVIGGKGYSINESTYNQYMNKEMIKSGIERMSGTPEEDDRVTKYRNYTYVRVVSDNESIVSGNTLFWCKVTDRRLMVEITPLFDQSEVVIQPVAPDDEVLPSFHMSE